MVKLPWTEPTFIEGRENVSNEERAGRPITSTADQKFDEVKKIVLANRRITVREVAEDLNTSIGSYHSIFTNDLGITRVAVKFVPKLLNFNQKQHRINIVITGDESWIYGYDVETKVRSCQWKLLHEPRPK